MSEINIDALTRTEKSILLYAETCLVDYGGLLEGRRMNQDDMDALKALAYAGSISFGRVPGSLLSEIRDRTGRHVTHWITFNDVAWNLAHAIRRERASKGSASRKAVDEYLGERTEARVSELI
ncbi:hypothetical protein [Burkholderia gladioli]|uniref:hypothetical protein n=1 Tax=Burkholderia gladioli TaxID=28095 RepID=UPI0016409F1B|nr:hypothetical protein [Burkholderia gladioli]